MFDEEAAADGDEFGFDDGVEEEFEGEAVDSSAFPLLSFLRLVVFGSVEVVFDVGLLAPLLFLSFLLAINSLTFLRLILMSFIIFICA